MTTLYRLYARDGSLLYIGIADSATRRFSQHARQKVWWPEVANITLETHPNRQAAENAEREAIRSEHPLHNVVHAARISVAAQPTIRIDWCCDECALAVDDGRGRIWIDYAEVHAAHEAQEPGFVSGGTFTLDLDELLSEGEGDAHWNVHHHQCVPEPEANAYNIDIERIRTMPQLLEWTAHLLESKHWLGDTDWHRLIATVASQMVGNPRHSGASIRGI